MSLYSIAYSQQLNGTRGYINVADGLSGFGGCSAHGVLNCWAEFGVPLNPCVTTFQMWCSDLCLARRVLSGL